MVEEVVYVDEQNNIVPAPRGMRSDSSSASYPPTNVRGEKADLLDKIRPDLVVETLRHKLMGEEQDKSGNWKITPALKDRAISEVGAWDLANLMLSASSQNVSLTRLNNDEIRARTLSIAKTAQLMCLKNWKEYGIKGVDQFAFVNEIVFTNTFITLKQPEGGGIRKLISDTTSENRQVNIQENAKRGLFRVRLK